MRKKLSKSLYSQRWEAMRRLLKELRREAGLTQAEVAKRLGRPQSLVAKIEAGERKLDVCQWIDYLEVIGADPVKAMRRLYDATGGKPPQEAVVRHFRKK